MSCKHCTNGVKLGTGWYMFEEWSSNRKMPDGEVGSLNFDFGEWTLEIEGDLPFGEGRWTFGVPVEHCPKCGRELTEYTEVDK